MAPAAARTQAAGPIVEFQIPESSLDSALQAYAHQSGRQLLYRSELVEGRRTPPLKGRYSADEALRRLLDGAPIATRQPSAGIVILSAGSPTANSGIPARLTPRARRRPAPAALHADSGEGDIIVTGSHIRGADEGTSPVAMIDRDQIDRQGHTTVAQTIAALPQNFSGMASEQSALTLADGSGTNASLATGVNLRGLGAGATLVLVNGRRLAGTGTMGDFNDVSSVPSATVERVEVLLDGASALYGSDAVGGVVNIILKDHYEGAQTRLQLGGVTKGGSREAQLGQTIGTRWATGSALLSYEYYHRDTLDSDSRAYARSADLHPLGGTDHRQFYSQPGNILSFDPATGAFGPAFAIPSGQNGTKLTPGDLLPGVVNLENQRLGTDLLPSQTRHSVYGRIAQDIGDHITLSIDARYSRRNFAVHGQGAPAVIVVTGANPYFVSPTGSPFDIIAYSFGRELGSSLTSGFAETIGISGGADVDLGHRWKARVYAAFAQQREQNRVSNIVNTQSLSEALGSVPNDPATAFNPAVDGYFNPYGDGPVNSAGILDFVGAGFQLVRSRSRVATYNIDADGPLFELPGGSVKLAVGGNIRRENFVTGGSLFLFTDAPTISPTRRSSRTVKAAFAELRIPLTGPDNAMPGVQRLEITAAGRIERYDDFGTTTNPKVGILWSPVTGVRLRSSYGTSFRAPNLREVNDTSRISATILPQANGTQTAVILMSGGNPDLGPEKARSWSAGIDLAPPPLRGLRANITWFRTRFDHRIGRPALDDLSNALINPALTPFVDYVSPSTDAADLARVTALLNDPSSTAQGSFPARSIGAIVDTRYVNTATTDVSGVDFAIGYAFDSSLDHFELGATGSYLLHYREKLTPTAPSIEEVNLAGHPVRFRGRLTGDWSHGAVGAGLTLSYANAYHDLAGHRVGSWSTIDFQLRYQPKAENGPLHGLRLAFNVQNLFDQDPPFYDSTSGVGYDAANADALGRFVSLQLTKEW
jgi:outer membrane receptor protein involved in Fe transport